MANIEKDFHKLPFHLRKLGDMLSVDCPMNDCIIYRNVIGLHDRLVSDYETIVECIPEIDEITLRAISGKIIKYQSELLDMYHENYAIQSYKREHGISF